MFLCRNMDNYPCNSLLIPSEQVLYLIPYFFGYKTGFFSFQNNPKVLDPSCKTDLEFWHCLGRVELVL